jgi:ADP-ribose pyrophosphatase
MWLYLATDLTETAQRLDDDEMIEIVRLPLERALQMITDGEIEDAKTIIGLMLAAPRIGLSAFAPDYPAA